MILVNVPPLTVTVAVRLIESPVTTAAVLNDTSTLTWAGGVSPPDTTAVLQLPLLSTAMNSLIPPVNPGDLNAVCREEPKVNCPLALEDALRPSTTELALLTLVLYPIAIA